MQVTDDTGGPKWMNAISGISDQPDMLLGLNPCDCHHMLQQMYA